MVEEILLGKVGTGQVVTSISFFHTVPDISS